MNGRIYDAYTGEWFRLLWQVRRDGPVDLWLMLVVMTPFIMATRTHYWVKNWKARRTQW